METNSLIISHWNCNSIKSHKPEIYSLINKKHNFICLNETKLSNSDNISFENYEIIRKDRNRRGGGVAILARTDMKFEKIDTLDSFGLELLAIKVKLIHNKYYTLDIFNCSPSIVYFKDPLHNHLISGSWRKTSSLQIWDLRNYSLIRDVFKNKNKLTKLDKNSP